MRRLPISPKGGYRNIVLILILRRNSRHFQIVPPSPPKYQITRYRPLTNLVHESSYPVRLTMHELSARTQLIKEPTLQLKILLSYLLVLIDRVSKFPTIARLLFTLVKHHVRETNIHGSPCTPSA